LNGQFVKGATNRTLFAWNDRPQKNRLEDGRLVRAVVSPAHVSRRCFPGVEGIA